MISKKTKLLVLVVWTALLAAVYWGFGNTGLTLPITYTYFGLCLVLSVLYVLVCGGIKPLLEADRKREEKSRKQYLADKGKLHPIKRRDRFRRFRIQSKTEQEKSEEDLPPPPNLLKIPEEIRPMISQILLLTVIPFYLIFMVDMILLKFIV